MVDSAQHFQFVTVKLTEQLTCGIDRTQCKTNFSCLKTFLTKLLGLQTPLYEKSGSGWITVITKPSESFCVVFGCGNEFNTTQAITKKFSWRYDQQLLLCMEIMAIPAAEVSLATVKNKDMGCYLHYNASSSLSMVIECF